MQVQAYIQKLRSALETGESRGKVSPEWQKQLKHRDTARLPARSNIVKSEDSKTIGLLPCVVQYLAFDKSPPKDCAFCAAMSKSI